MKDYILRKDYMFSHIGKPGSPLLVFIGDIPFNPESFKGLNVGDRVNRIGNNSTGVGSGMAALNRSADFKPYVTYVGKANIEEFGEDDLIFFEVREEDKAQFVTEKMYVAYIVLDHGDVTELKLWDHANNTIWIARPEFNLYKE